MITKEEVANNFVRQKIKDITAELSKEVDVISIASVDETYDGTGYFSDDVKVTCNRLGNTVNLTFDLQYEVTDSRVYSNEEVELGDGKKAVWCYLSLFKPSSHVKTDFKRFTKDACTYYQTKSIKKEKKRPKQAYFNLYLTICFLALLVPVAFAGFSVYGYANMLMTSGDSVISSTLGGTQTLWIIIGINFGLALFSMILNATKIDPYLRPDSGVNMVLHIWLFLIIELVTMLFAWLASGDMGIFSYTLGNLFFPAILACVIYPIWVTVMLFMDLDDYNVKYIMNNFKFNEPILAKFGNVEAKLIDAAVKITDNRLKNIQSIVKDFEEAGVKISVTKV